MKRLFLLVCLAAGLPIIGNNIFDALDEQMVKADSLVCVGLDPDISKLPLSIIDQTLSPEENIYKFLVEVIDITAPHACSFKLQKAFYDKCDRGHWLLKKTVTYIHERYPGIPVWVDCKIGDVDNTMKAYMDLLFDDIGADGVVINPYMGDDVLAPFLNDAKKTSIVLVQTSNQNAKVVQELLLANGRMLWEEILSTVLNRWNCNKNLIVVLSSNTFKYDYKFIRQQIPQDVPILLAGVGQQGGDPRALKDLLNDKKRGVFVNSSRGILYPYDQSDKEWRSAILRAVIDLKNTLNFVRDR